MPRIDNLGPSADAWAKATENGTSTWDVCRACYLELLDDPHTFDWSLKPYNVGEPEGETGRLGDVDHPNYDDHFSTCDVCNRLLIERRDGDGREIARKGRKLGKYIP